MLQTFLLHNIIRAELNETYCIVLRQNEYHKSIVYFNLIVLSSVRSTKMNEKYQGYSNQVQSITDTTVS